MRRPLADAGLFFILIIFVLQVFRPISYNHYDELDGITTRIHGTVVRREYKQRDDSRLLIIYLKNYSFYNYHDVLSDDSMIICYLDEENGDAVRPSIGSSITVKGKISTFGSPTNSGEFDTQKYYDIMNIRLSVYNCRIENYDLDQKLPLNMRVLNHLALVRDKLGILCDLCFWGDDCGIVKTMLLGDKSSLNPEIKELYSYSGIAHILAISGLHISLLGMILYNLMSHMPIPRPICSAITIIFMIMYGFMTGMSTSAARAVIMFSLRMIGALIGRTYDVKTSLTVAAVLLLIEQPGYLFYSGFQFSFGAVFGLVYIFPLLKQIMHKGLAATVALNLVTLPIYLNNYYYFPLGSLLLNMLVIPLMSVLLVLMTASLILAAIYIPAGTLLAGSVHFILELYSELCKLINHIPLCRIVTGKPLVLQLFIYALLISLTLIFMKYQNRIQLILNLCFAGILLTGHLSFGTELTLIDVGQGDGIYITDNCGTSILVDGGSSTNSSVGKYILEPFMLSKGVASLDAVFISHMDSDHYNGVLEMIEDAGESGPLIQKIIFSNSTICAESPEYLDLAARAMKKNIDIYQITKGDVYREGEITIECLYPDQSCHGENTNSESLVLLLNTNNADIYLTGDLEGDGEVFLCNELKERKSNKPAILKVAHHGSKNSTSKELLMAMHPSFALISAGRNNRYGHPHEETLERLYEYVPDEKVLRTDECGQVTVKADKSEVRINRFIDVN